MFDRNAVQEAVNAIIRANNGRTFLEPDRARNYFGIQGPLHELLRTFGVSDSDVHVKVTGDELAALYAATRKDALTGSRVAQRIQAKYQHNPLFDPPKAAPQPIPSPAPTPAPPVATPAPREPVAPSIDLDVAIKAVRELLNEERDRAARELATAVDAIEGRIAETVAAAIRDRTPTELTITAPNAAPIPLGLVHSKTEKLIRMLAAGSNVYLHGPAGSGKTTAAQKAATALGLDFYFAAKVESEYLLLGFKDARGETVRTQFREAYEHGGLFLFDELDGSSPQAVVALNAALANGICPFPDGTIKRHDNFKCIGAGNTVLGGASRMYVGRSQLDAASIDRFDFLVWGYDEQLERALATDQNWCAFVQAVRKTVMDRALNHLVTPRATIGGCKLLAAGFAWDEVADMVVYKGLDADTVSQIKSATRYSAPTVRAMAA
jgi:cobaltochelatase CobS